MFNKNSNQSVGSNSSVAHISKFINSETKFVDDSQLTYGRYSSDARGGLGQGVLTIEHEFYNSSIDHDLIVIDGIRFSANLVGRAARLPRAYESHISPNSLIIRTTYSFNGTRKHLEGLIDTLDLSHFPSQTHYKKFQVFLKELRNGKGQIRRGDNEEVLIKSIAIDTLVPVSEIGVELASIYGSFYKVALYTGEPISDLSKSVTTDLLNREINNAINIEQYRAQVDMVYVNNEVDTPQALYFHYVNSPGILVSIKDSSRESGVYSYSTMPKLPSWNSEHFDMVGDHTTFFPMEELTPENGFFSSYSLAVNRIDELKNRYDGLTLSHKATREELQESKRELRALQDQLRNQASLESERANTTKRTHEEVLNSMAQSHKLSMDRVKLEQERESVNTSNTITQLRNECIELKNANTAQNLEHQRRLQEIEEKHRLELARERLAAEEARAKESRRREEELRALREELNSVKDELRRSQMVASNMREENKRVKTNSFLNSIGSMAASVGQLIVAATALFRIFASSK